jgi:wyosine [tRNA(Phe)-imidazoG37] synthetase (radical SAM superfamily)
LGIKIAVISNSSLIWREDVRRELARADWVSLKFDSVRIDAWRQIDRPHGSLSLQSIMEGARAFARDFRGTLVTETMLVEGLNDDEAGLRELAGFLAELHPTAAYLAIPTRPPAEPWARAPDEAATNRAYQILAGRVGRVEHLIGYEGNSFAFTGDVEEDLLSITAVHPMRRDGVAAFLRKAGADWPVVHGMVADGRLRLAEYEGHLFYVRALPGPGR